MDVRKLALLKALDDAERTTYSEQLLAWQKSQAAQSKDDPKRDAPPQYIEIRTGLERIARDNGVTLNDVVLIALGRKTRSPVEPLAAEILAKIPEHLLALVRSIDAQWPAEEPEFVAPPTEPKPVRALEVSTAPTPSTSTIAPKTGPKRGRKTKVTEQANGDTETPQEATSEAPVTQASVRPTEGQP
jgi:hypothetical protein